MPFLCWHISVEALQINGHFPFLCQLPHQWSCSLSEAKETLIAFLLVTLPEKRIPQATAPNLLYRSFPLGLAGFQCSHKALKMFSCLSPGISDLACIVYRAEEC